jgi:hypothetical protein
MFLNSTCDEIHEDSDASMVCGEGDKGEDEVGEMHNTDDDDLI